METQRPRNQHVHGANLPATILRDGGLSCPANITRLWYDGCEMDFIENLAVGEKIKFVIRGMGSINAHVISTAEGTLSAHFVEECPA